MKLELVDIKKSFGEKHVLEGISFNAEGGRAFGLLGRNGAGKTTTIRILMNVFNADSGSIYLDGKSVDYKTTLFGYLPEERGLYPKKKIIEQLVFFAELHGMNKKDAVKSIDSWLKRLGMSEYRNKRLDTLSKGNQQKIQLITALAHNPDIIMLDEPFSGLDPVNAMLLKDVIRQEIEKGKIVLFSSHQMNYIEEFCDSIAIIKDGKTVLTGDLEDIKHSYPRDRLIVKSSDAERISEIFPDSVCRSENEVLIKLEDEKDKKTAMKKITAAFDTDEIKVAEPSLNDIFVEYTADKEGK